MVLADEISTEGHWTLGHAPLSTSSHKSEHQMVIRCRRREHLFTWRGNEVARCLTRPSCWSVLKVTPYFLSPDEGILGRKARRDAGN